MNKKRSSFLLLLSLLVVVLILRTEIVRVYSGLESQETLYSAAGFLAIILYTSLFLMGFLAVVAAFWGMQVPDHLITVWNIMRLRWLAFSVLVMIVVWIYLYSPLQFVLKGAWTQFFFALGFVQLTSLLLAPRQSRARRWGELALVISVFLFPQLVNEIRLLTGSSLISRAMTLLGYGYILGLAVVIYHPMGGHLTMQLLHLRDRLGITRWPIIVFFWMSPIVYHYAVGSEITSLYAALRFLVLLVSLCVTSFLFCEKQDVLVSVNSLVTNLGVLILFFAVDDYLLLVVNYPFGLYWSEGNRLYDYSLVFGQSLYNYAGTIVNSYGTQGRYGLWGILFLVKGLPIWVHRLWNLILQIVPPLIFSFLITKKVRPDGLRYQIVIWIALFFIVLAPLHPPFMVASIIIAWFAFDESLIKRGASVLLAGYYVAISRFTWAFAPAAMGVLIDLFLYYPQRTGNWFRRLLPEILLAVLGMTPGLYINFAMFQSTLQGDSYVGKQSLLWYRLLPNPTLGPGILLLTLIYTSPLLIFIAWWMYTKQWKLDIWQKLATWGALLGFLAAGLVFSTKIGGGGDLHNLDMYLVTLMLVVVLGLTEVLRGVDTIRFPDWAVSLVVLLILLPLYHYWPVNPSASTSLGVADDAVVQKVLSTIRSEVEKASQNGEVLFMDQRQLLTFGYMPAIPFVPEYEKKYMMDQAMANNATYFKPYYQDLAKKRFTLIVTEVLRSKLKSDIGGPFSEENDAFVTWVSNPTLCFYDPIYTSRETNIMLLVPRADTSQCADYLK